MTTSTLGRAFEQMARTASLRDGAERTDAQLLGRFVQERDEAAFEALLRRHGPMVLGVCRRLLGDQHAAEDAFQATFLVLARKAATVVPRELVANWLHGVACHVAMKARAMSMKRRSREKQVANMPEPAAVVREDWDDARELLDQELGRLPEKYRVPLVLCELEGKTHKEAARQLGWPEGTVAGRLSRGRAMLAERLKRRGVQLSGSLLAAILSQQAAAGVPAALLGSTIEAARLMLAGKAAAGVISTGAAALTKGVLQSMLLNKLKTIGVMVLAVGLVGVGAGQISPAPRAAEPEDRGNPMNVVAALGVPQPAPENPFEELKGQLEELQRKLDERDKMARRIEVLKDWRKDVLDKATEERDDLARQISVLGRRIEALLKQLTTKPLPQAEDAKNALRIADGVLEGVDLKHGTITVALGRKVDEVLAEVLAGAKGEPNKAVSSRTVARLADLAVAETAQINISFRTSPSVANHLQQQLKDLEKMKWWPATVELAIQDGRLVVTKITAWRGGPREFNSGPFGPRKEPPK
jgi:RNA polymerase sigma factor (sigma-70 family)